MSKRFELSISVDYVQTWRVWEAVRELWQNALDFGEHNWTWESLELKGKSNVLRIISKNVQLEKKSLLLGTSTKRDDSKNIGKWGEGYKLAALVLTRMGKQVKIYNNKACEMWTPKIIKSRRYNSDLLVVDVTSHVPDDLCNNDLVFEITGLTKAEWDEVMEKNLNITPLKKHTSTSFGEILFDKKFVGKVFVGGLFVCDVPVKGYRYGYNIKPQHIELDRDRQSVRGFNFQWMTSQMWEEVVRTTNQRNSLVFQLIDGNAPDVLYFNNFSGKNSSDIISNIFLNKHGTKSVAVSSDDDLKQAKRMYGDSVIPVVVSENQRDILKKSEVYQDNIKSIEVISVSRKSPRGIVSEIYNKLYEIRPHATELSSGGLLYDEGNVEEYKKEVARAFNKLIAISGEWRWD